MYHDFEVKYHDFGLPIVKSMLFFSNVRTFANRLGILAFEWSPLDGQPMPKARALIAHSLGTHCP